MTTPSQGKDRVRQPILWLTQFMFVIDLTVPLMLVAVAIAVVPLLWGMKHQLEWEECDLASVVLIDDEDARIAA